MNSINVPSFIDLVKTASQVQLTLTGGLTTLCTAQVLTRDADGALLRLLWSRNCETLLTAAGIAEGHWSLDTFFCNELNGRPVQLKMLAVTVLSPQASAAGQLDQLLKTLLSDGMVNRKDSSPAMLNALQVAVWEGPQSVLRLLFPQQLQMLQDVREMLHQAREHKACDWEMLAPLFDRASNALDAGYGSEVTWSPDNNWDELDSETILDFLKDVVMRTDDLERESELTWRLLVLAVNQLEQQQLSLLLQGLQKRLVDPVDDTRDLTTMPIKDVLAMISHPGTPPVAEGL